MEGSSNQLQLTSLQGDYTKQVSNKVSQELTAVLLYMRKTMVYHQQ